MAAILIFAVLKNSSLYANGSAHLVERPSQQTRK